MILNPAAFGRLCVETLINIQPVANVLIQPPSGGCVLKQGVFAEAVIACGQPPSGGCVLKLFLAYHPLWACRQPPSGGCVLKQKRFVIGLTGCYASRLRAAVC